MDNTMDQMGMTRVVIPLASSREQIARVAAAISEAQRAVDNAKGQLACLEAFAFFEDHPEVKSVQLGGSWESDDNGGSSFYLSASVKRHGGADEGSDGEENEDEDEDYDSYELTEELVETLSQWNDLFEGMTLSKSNVVETVGKAIMDDGAFNAWRSACERVELAKSTPEGVACVAEPLRV